jgi:hypothetical protein
MGGCDWRTSELKHEPEEIPDAEHELVIERVAAVDVAKASGKVCVRVPGKAGRRVSRVWDVAATTAAVTELAEDLVELGVERVTVESTSDYWRIWYYLLEAAGLEVQLVNARDVKNVPGPGQDGQARRRLAGQADREGPAAAEFRAAGTDPAIARLHPAAPISPTTGPGRCSGWRNCSKTP